MTGSAHTGATFERLGLMALRVEAATAAPETPVAGLAVDSRAVRDGFVFFALPGTALDGADFAQYAIRQGAVAVVSTAAGLERVRATVDPLQVPVFVTEAPRRVLAESAARFFPDQPGTIAAVTGTNGKTSTAHFLRQIWAMLGLKAVTFGTAGIEGAGFEGGPSLTTPEPIALHRLLAELTDHQVTHVAMEASSHGLAQHRLDGVRLAVAGLSNIGRDHLDYHASFEDYVAAKLRLFSEVLPAGGVAVLNADDPTFEAAAQAAVQNGCEVLTFGRVPSADLQLAASVFRHDGQTVEFRWKGDRFRVELNLIGAFQAENVALAAALAIAAGAGAPEVFAVLSDLEGVRGRMQLAGARANGAAVFVDYAHTPDALATAIDALRPHCQGNLVVVFGAGGDRDRGKRPLMGRAVAERADIAIVTDDNPRSENPASIRAQILPAIPMAHEIGDRAAAILAGVDMLKEPGDCLLIAGKGHEQGQEVAGAVLAFDDIAQARASIGALDGWETDQGGGT